MTDAKTHNLNWSENSNFSLISSDANKERGARKGEKERDKESWDRWPRCNSLLVARVTNKLARERERLRKEREREWVRFIHSHTLTSYTNLTEVQLRASQCRVHTHTHSLSLSLSWHIPSSHPHHIELLLPTHPLKIGTISIFHSPQPLLLLSLLLKFFCICSVISQFAADFQSENQILHTLFVESHMSRNKTNSVKV